MANINASLGSVFVSPMSPLSFNGWAILISSPRERRCWKVHFPAVGASRPTRPGCPPARSRDGVEGLWPSSIEGFFPMACRHGSDSEAARDLSLREAGGKQGYFSEIDANAYNLELPARSASKKFHIGDSGSTTNSNVITWSVGLYVNISDTSASIYLGYQGSYTNAVPSTNDLQVGVSLPWELTAHAFNLHALGIPSQDMAPSSMCGPRRSKIYRGLLPYFSDGKHTTGVPGLSSGNI